MHTKSNQSKRNAQKINSTNKVTKNEEKSKTTKLLLFRTMRDQRGNDIQYQKKTLRFPIVLQM